MAVPTSPNSSTILRGLECSRGGCGCHASAKKGKGLTHCPSHTDDKISLNVNESNGKVLVKCHAGCDQDKVIGALRERGLWPDRGEGGSSTPSRTRATVQPPGDDDPAGLTVAAYAEAKRLDAGSLRELGLSDFHYMGKPAVRIPYWDQFRATEQATRYRLDLEGGDRFRWKSGTKPCPYGLWRLSEAREAGRIVLVEGESDCHTLWSHGIPALGLPGAGTWQEVWADYLDGIDTILAIVEPDQGGQALRKWLATSRIRARVRLVDLGKHKDPSGLHLTGPEKFTQLFETALLMAQPWTEVEAEAARVRFTTAWDVCADLAQQEDLLSDIVAVLRQLGLVGEERAAKLVYLALTSRLLMKPVNLALKGPSAVGKSFLVERVLSLFPRSASYTLSAMSDRLLAYTDEPLEHRVLVLVEAAGLRSDFASYLLRSLLSEGRLRYAFVEKTSKGLKPRLIEKTGPTGLIVTTTEVRLHAENETRLFSVPISDSSEQTKAVMLASANGAGGELIPPAWPALQEWLAADPGQVVVPYAVALAEAIPPLAVRLRRDFTALLGLVSTHALLHRASRERDPDGRVIAAIDDYSAVRGLVVDLVAEGVGASVPETVRQTVAVVVNLTEGEDENGVRKTATVTQVAKALKLDKSSAQRRVRRSLDLDYLVNLEDRRGRPARLAVGDPLPDEQDILPTPERLQGCSDAGGVTTSPPSPDGVCPKGGAHVFQGAWAGVPARCLKCSEEIAS